MDRRRKPSLRTGAERDALVTRYRGVPFFVLRKMIGHRLRVSQDRDEIIQIGMIALMRAAELWDASNGTTFLSYAIAACRSRMWRRVIDEAREQDDRQSLEATLAKSLTGEIDELAAPPDCRLSAYVDEERLHAMLARIPARFRELLEFRYMDGLNMRETAVRMGVSYQRVCQLEHKATVSLLRQIRWRGGRRAMLVA